MKFIHGFPNPTQQEDAGQRSAEQVLRKSQRDYSSAPKLDMTDGGMHPPYKKKKKRPRPSVSGLLKTHKPRLIEKQRRESLSGISSLCPFAQGLCVMSVSPGSAEVNKRKWEARGQQVLASCWGVSCSERKTGIRLSCGKRSEI